MSLSNVFFTSGLTITILIERGTVPASNEMWIIFVTVGSSVDIFKNPVAIASKAHDFLGFLLITLETYMCIDVADNPIYFISFHLLSVLKLYQCSS